MHIEPLLISALTPAPYNPRIALCPGDAAWERLKRSLDEFDLVQPIVWNRRTGHVVAGHQRLEILKHEGRTEVDCVVVDLPLEREQALNITLNNASVAGDWDPEKLVAVLDDLQELPDFDPTLTGFDEQQLQDLILAPDPDFSPAEAGRLCGEDEDESGTITATLEVPEEVWSDVQSRLDDLLAESPQVRLHVRVPRGVV